MCLAIPGRIVKLDGRKALIDYGGNTEPAMVSIEGVKLGDWVQVQMGLIVAVLTKAEAKVAKLAIDEHVEK